MKQRGFWRLIAPAVAILMVASATAVWADDILLDADLLVVNDQLTVDLGTVAAGSVQTPQVSFRLSCTGRQHVDNAQTVTLSQHSATLDGVGVTAAVVSATSATIGAIPLSWPDDAAAPPGTTNCGTSPPAPLVDNGNSTVTFTAPAAPGPHTVTVTYSSTLAPAGSNDNTAISGNDVATFTFTVGAPPDTTNPTVNCSPPDNSIWYAANVTVPCTASDSGSGLADPADASFSLVTTVTSGNETASAATGSRTVFDNAGNSTTVGPYTFKVDRKAPGLSCVPSSASLNWLAGEASFNCSASDGGSGLADAGDATFVLTTAVGAGNEDANASTGSKTVLDAVGNSSSIGPITGNMVDRKAPVVLCGSADGLWHGANVSIACTGTDGGSGLADSADASFNLVTNVLAGTETNNASTDSRTVLDDVGNSTTAGPITGNMVDLKAPGVSCGSADGLWHAADVSINCTAADGGSGLLNAADAAFTLSTSVDAGTETNNASTGSYDVYDNVGNYSTAGPVSGNMVDKKGPTVLLTCPISAVILGSSAFASWNASDGGSGVAGVTAGSVTLDTSSVGGHTATVGAGTVVDNVGNGSPVATCTYSVIYNWSGFFRPIDNGGVYNVVKAGQGIPAKWSLGGYQGLDILAAGSPTSKWISCDISAGTDTIEETVTAGSSSLHYDATVDQYVYVWKSDKSWAGTCRQFTVTLNDGTVHTALFKFTR